MGKEYPKEWYDKSYIDSNYNLPIHECGYYNLYKTVLSLMPYNKGIKILELGCGTGRLARLLYDNGYKRYIGIDFSEIAIQSAKKYAPECTFIVEDIVSDCESNLFKTADLFIILETLEHIEKDRLVIERIPEAKRVIISVPPNDYKSHVRFFDSFESIEKRYGDLLDFSSGRKFRISNNLKPHKDKLFLCDPMRRGE